MRGMTLNLEMEMVLMMVRVKMVIKMILPTPRMSWW
jgi:hypothetical protein